MLPNMKSRLFLNSRLAPVVMGNVILLVTLAISLISVGSINAASSNTIPSLSSNSTQPPKPLPGSQTFLKVTTKVNGGTKKPSDFTVTVSGNSPSPKSFSGSSSGTSVTLFGGSYKVTESGTSGYSPSYSSGCSGTATGGRIQCTITNQYLIGSQTFLTVTTKVNGGTKKPSDFTVTVSGNSPSPKSFSGSSSGTSVTLFGGSYKVTESGTSGYSPSYSSGCSGTATGGRIQCTITNQYHGAPNPTPNKSITLTSNSINVYSIPSASVQVEKFLTNYTISGELSSINASRDLITSTIINDFDSSPNIGYVKSNNIATTSPNSGSPATLPNPFVSTDTINQKITNETHNIIMAASTSNPAGKNVEIKCTFGDVLSDYRCSHIP
jgi:hypothetical protein